MTNNRIEIENKEGIIIYGRVINNHGKLGNYELYSDMYGDEEHIYSTYAEVEKRKNAILYAMAKNQKQKQDETHNAGARKTNSQGKRSTRH